MRSAWERPRSGRRADRQGTRSTVSEGRLVVVSAEAVICRAALHVTGCAGVRSAGL